MSPKTGWWSPHLGQHFGWLDPPCLLFRSPVTLSKRFVEPCWAVEAPCSSSFSHLQFVAEKGRQLVGPDVNVLTKISTHMQQKWGLRWMSTKIWWFHVISNIYFGSLNPWQWSHLTNYSYMTICRVRQLLVYPYCAVWAGLDLYNLDQLAHLPLKTSTVNDWAWYRCRQLSRFGFADRAGFYIYDHLYIGGTQMTRGEVVTQKNTRRLVKFALNFPLDRSQAEQLRLLPGSEQRGSRRRIDPFHVAMVSQGFYFFLPRKSQVYLWHPPT